MKPTKRVMDSDSPTLDEAWFAKARPARLVLPPQVLAAAKRPPGRRPQGGKVTTPTLAPVGASLPPKGALAALGRPGVGKVTAPTLAPVGASLPPKGALAALGRPGVGKESTTVRFDRDILDAFRANGPGWQTRMNAALREWLNTHSAA